MKTYINPNKTELLELLKRPELEQKDLSDLVKGVFDRIKTEGDKALTFFSKEFDKADLDSFLVTNDELDKAVDSIDDDLKHAIYVAIQNIETFHKSQKEEEKVIQTMPGVKCWRKSVGIDKVGLYIPGGTAPLFSTVLMLAIPAKIAGCKEIVLCSPPNAEGKIHPAILFAAQAVGVTKIFKLGGIQAIGAMSIGTKTVPAVYKLFGPGNQYVTAAKQYAQSIGLAIDMPAGPSEVMVVADNSANAEFVAADLLSQAEHGMDSQVILLTDDKEFPAKVDKAIEKQLEVLPRAEFAKSSLRNSKSIVVNKGSLIETINEYGPEHLILNTSFNDELLSRVTNAGSVFIGPYTPESAGDYASGTNHTLPTNGYAKMYSGVSLDSFVKKITYQEITKEGILNVGPVVEKMAAAEQLDAHKLAVTVRLNAIRD